MCARRGTGRTTLIRSVTVTILHLNLVTPNFGIQEETFFDEKTREVFPGTPEIRKGYIYSNDKPGFGIDIDEKAAARYPYTRDFEDRGNDRMLDGTIVRP